MHPGVSFTEEGKEAPGPTPKGNAQEASFSLKRGRCKRSEGGISFRNGRGVRRRISSGGNPSHCGCLLKMRVLMAMGEPTRVPMGCGKRPVNR